jgi:ERCC4-type nuclease
MQNIVDTREPKNLSESFIRAGWTPEALEHGDYGLQTPDGMALVERKTSSQFLTDMQSGQLLKQCRALCESTRFPILLKEGLWIEIDGRLLGTNFTLKQVRNQIMTIQNMGCRYEPTANIEDTITRIFELAEYYKEEIHESAIRELVGNPKLYVLRLISGVGPAKAKLLLEKYGNLKTLTNTPELELMNMKGIGQVLGKRIFEFFN